MKNKRRYFIWFSGVLFLFLGCILLCFQFLLSILKEMEKRTTLDSKSYVVYDFEPEAILNSLESEKSDEEVFTVAYAGESEDVWDDMDPRKTTMPPVRWTQEDYLKIANEAGLQFTGEPLGDWSLNFLLFRMLCNEAELGPQSMGLTLFKAGASEDERTELNIDVYPRSGQIGIRKLFYSTYTLSTGRVPFERVMISFDTAFALAEEKGGRSARQSVDNNCEVRASYVAGDDDHWSVKYMQSPDIGDIFEIWIDEQSGKYKIIKSQ